MNSSQWKIHPRTHRKSASNNASKRLIATVIIAGIIVLGSIIISYNNQTSHPNHESIPIIDAEDGVTKVRPHNAEKVRLEHDDKLVYDRLESSETKHNKETFLPEPENPMIIKDYIPDTPPQDAEQEAMEQVILTDEDAVLLSEDLEETAAQSVNVIDHIHTNCDLPHDHHTQKPAMSGSYVVQVASVKTHQLAQTITNQFISKFKGITTRIQKIDLGAKKGVFFRVQLGNFDTRQEAETLCDKIKSTGKDCFVAKK